jgi:hypothetical protein
MCLSAEARARKWAMIVRRLSCYSTTTWPETDGQQIDGEDSKLSSLLCLQPVMKFLTEDAICFKMLCGSNLGEYRTL